MRANKKPRQVILIGIDGFDSKILAAMMGRGELTNFARLAEKGFFNRNETVFPPKARWLC
jgi:hypothetical protein